MFHCKSLRYTDVGKLNIGLQEPAVFDFTSVSNWAICRPHLNDPWLVGVLDETMRASRRGLPKSPRWKRSNGPWWHSWGDHWFMRASEAFEAAEPDWHERNAHLWPGEGKHEWSEDCPPDCDCEDPPQAYLDAQDEARAKYEPQPGTYQWYQAFGRCHWMADWCAALGTLVYPRLQWCAYFGEKHSTAVGLDEGRLAMIFDVLWFEDHDWRQIINGVEGGNEPPRLYAVSRARSAPGLRRSSQKLFHG
jgi:hypothetical protein